MAFAMGITIEEFKHMTPTEFEYCLKGYKIRRNAQNIDLWTYAVTYLIPAIKFGVRSGAWGKDKVDFPSEPIKLNNNEEPTEDEIEKKRKEFALQMKTMKANWDLTHKKG